MILRVGLLAGLVLGIAACQSAPERAAPVPNSSAVAGVTPQGFRLPEGAGCSGDIARFQAIIDNDLQTGHTTQSVHTQMSNELGKAGAACAAGRDGEARASVRAIRARFGYPA